jgi:hypothetical protein
VLAAVALLVPAAAARAEARWTAPVTIDAPGGAFSPTLTAGAGGSLLATWQTQTGTAVGSRARGATLRATGSVPGSRLAVARTGSDSLLLITRGVPSNRTLRAFDVAANGRVVRDTTITPGYVLDAAAAANRRGAAVVAWIARDGSVQARVRSAAGRSFHRAQTLAPASAHAAGIAAAVSLTGEVVVLWAQDNRRVLARIGDNDEFGRAVTVGRHDGVANMVAAYSAGRLYAVWGTHDGGEQVDRPLVVHASSRARRATRFGRDRILHRSAPPGPLGAPEALRLVALRGGGAAAAWTSWSKNGSSVQTMIAGAGGAFGPVRRLDADGALDDLAATPAGDLLVSWTRPSSALPPRGDGSALRVMVAVRPAGGGFGPAEAVSPPGGSGSALTADAGRATAAWVSAGGQLQVSDREP